MQTNRFSDKITAEPDLRNLSAYQADALIEGSFSGGVKKRAVKRSAI